MAIINIKNAQPYRTHVEALNALFGCTYKQYIPAKKEISKNQWVVFFNLAEADANGVWKPSKKNVNWLNIPGKKDKAFVQIELNKQGDEYFENVNPPRYNAVFMWRKGSNGKYAYHFYGIFKRTCYNEAIGLNIYEQTYDKLNTDKWQCKSCGKKPAPRKGKK